MRHVRSAAVAVACVLLCSGATEGAQAPASSVQAESLAPPPLPAVAGEAAEVVGHPDPLSLLVRGDPQLAANKQLVFDTWRSIVNAGQVGLADAMLKEDYIQHSPVIPTGRAAFKAVFSAIAPRTIPDRVSPPLVTILAEGDLVVMALREEVPPQGSEAGYTTTHFNLFRVEDGQLAEHWHSVEAEPGPDLPGPDEGGPQRVTGASGPDQAALLAASDPALLAGKRLVFDAWRQVIEGGRGELAALYFDEDFIEHDPNRASGLASLIARITALGERSISSALAAPLVAMVAEGDLVVQVSAREHPHPHRPGESYTTTAFNMFRIANGRLAEHWSGASRPGRAPQNYSD